MKSIYLLLVCLLANVAAAAEAKWLTSLPRAEAQARAEHKLVLLDFTGSDWCPGCMELEKNVLSKPEFANYAASNLVLMLVDFPIRTQPDDLHKANDALQQKYKVDGYPTLMLVNSDGKKLWEIEGYEGETPKQFIAKVEAARRQYSK